MECQLGVGKGTKEEDELEEEQQQQQQQQQQQPPQRQARDMSFWQAWRDLIPVVKIELNMASVGLYCFLFLFY